MRGMIYKLSINQPIDVSSHTREGESNKNRNSRITLQFIAIAQILRCPAAERRLGFESSLVNPAPVSISSLGTVGGNGLRRKLYADSKGIPNLMHHSIMPWAASGMKQMWKDCAITLKTGALTSEFFLQPNALI